MNNEMAQIRTELLAWAGLHRGKNINEKAMPEFHKIIDKLEQLAEVPEAKVTVEVVDRLGYRRAYDHVAGDEKSEKRVETLFSRYVNGDIRDLTISSD